MLIEQVEGGQCRDEDDPTSDAQGRCQDPAIKPTVRNPAIAHRVKSTDMAKSAGPLPGLGIDRRPADIARTSRNALVNHRAEIRSSILAPRRAPRPAPANSTNAAAPVDRAVFAETHECGAGRYHYGGARGRMGAVWEIPEQQHEAGNDHDPAADAERPAGDSGNQTDGCCDGETSGAHGCAVYAPALRGAHRWTTGILERLERKAHSTIVTVVRLAVFFLVILLLVVGACTVAPEPESMTTTTLGGAASPEEALNGLFDAIVGGNYQDTALLTFDDQLALMVSLEGFELPETVSMLRDGLPDVVRDNFWKSFSAGFPPLSRKNSPG